LETPAFERAFCFFICPCSRIQPRIGSGFQGIAPLINYRMHISGGEWKVVDVAVDGISLVRSYRGSFASEIKANGLQSLIGKLTEKNEKLASALTGGN